MPHLRQMYSYLMRSAGQRSGLDERALGERLEHFEFCLTFGALTFRLRGIRWCEVFRSMGRSFGRHLGDLPESLLGGSSSCESKIPLLDGLLLELSLQGGGTPLVSCHEQQAARVPVEAVHEHEVVSPRSPSTRLLEQPLELWEDRVFRHPLGAVDE